VTPEAGAVSPPAHAGSTPPTVSFPSTANRPSDDESSALVVFVSPGPLPVSRSEDNAIETEFSSIPTLSTGILSATQGTYKTNQLLLDITQGARVSYSAYSPAYPPALSLLVITSAPIRAHSPIGTLTRPSLTPYANVRLWAAARKRAEGAPQLLRPGLLASSIPGGGAYAASSAFPGRYSLGSAGSEDIDGPLATNRSGQIAAVSLGLPSTLLARIAALQSTHRLVVADLPAGAPGYADLRTLAATRPSSELLIALQRAPEALKQELLWSAFAGTQAGDSGDRTITSQTTNERGMIAAIDIGPTILDHLGLAVPADMRGKPVRLDGPLHSSSLRGLKARLEVLDSRRLPALGWLVAAWALLLAAARLPLPVPAPRRDAQNHENGNDERASRHDQHGRRIREAWAMRVGALAMLWTPIAVLPPAALEPSRGVEFALIVGISFALGALTDLLVPWPRAPIAPAVAAVLALTVDALAGTQLLMRSLLGPNPAFGARFYGIGNELKSGLAVLVFAAVAAALYPAMRGRRAATTMACAGILLAIVEGSARIGAGVGGVILVSAGTAVATVMLLPGAFNRRRALIVMAAPVVGLVALAAIDLTTAHGSGHFTGSVLDARSPGDIRDIIVRRYSAAWDELKNHLMPLATALALFGSAIAIRRRERVFAPIHSDPAWLAALAGGLTAGAIGALSEDSGPELLVVAVFVLGCVLSYLWGSPHASHATHEAVDQARQGRIDRGVLST
jgi:hypothetical protein